MSSRHRFDAEHWRAVLERWQQSGLTLHAFAKQQDLNYLSLRYWRRKLDPPPVAEPPSVAAFVPLTLLGEPAVEIALPGGVVLRVPLSFPDGEGGGRVSAPTPRVGSANDRNRPAKLLMGVDVLGL